MSVVCVVNIVRLVGYVVEFVRDIWRNDRGTDIQGRCFGVCNRRSGMLSFVEIVVVVGAPSGLMCGRFAGAVTRADRLGAMVTCQR